MARARKLIEVALPLEAMNEASARERRPQPGHPRRLHPWPDGRPLATSRALVFGSVVDDPDDQHAQPDFVAACASLPPGRNAREHDTPRHRLLDFVERLVRWESTTDEEALATARELIRLSTDGDPPALWDPFAGSGVIPVEAQRLGLEVQASDLNPIATVINRALIEIPPRFRGRPAVNPLDRTLPLRGAAGLAADIRYYARWIRARAWERIGHRYPEYVPPAWGLPQRVIAWLWAYTVECPNPECGGRAPLVTSLWLSKRAEGSAWLAPRVAALGRAITFDVERGEGGPGELPRARRGAKHACAICGTPIDDGHILHEGTARRLGMQLRAVVTEGRHGPDYFAPLQSHEEAAGLSDRMGWLPAVPSEEDLEALPRLAGAIQPRLLYAPRQLAALAALSELVAEARDAVHSDALSAGLSRLEVTLRRGGSGARAYSEAVSVYLALGLSRQALLLNTLCSWNPSRERCRSARRRTSIRRLPWEFAEANPFSGVHSGFLQQLEPIWEAVEALDAPSLGRATRRDATRYGYRRPYVFATDPPYYDSTMDPHLSDQAYAWLRRTLGNIYPDVLDAEQAPLEGFLIAAPPRPGPPTEEGGQAEDPFAHGLERAFAMMRGGADLGYPLTVYCIYDEARSRAGGAGGEGWETMLEALVQAGFAIEATWPIRVDEPKPDPAYHLEPAPEVILVCRPRSRDAPTATHQEFASALRRELPAALHEIRSNRLAPVDLAQSKLGAGLAIFSRYASVLAPDGSPMRVHDALGSIRRALETFLFEQSAYLDHVSRFAVAWFDRFGHAVHSEDEAQMIAHMNGTTLAKVIDTGVLKSRGSRTWLVRWQDLDARWHVGPGRPPLVWKATHHLMRRLSLGGERDAAALLAEMAPELGREARQLAYQLYGICERQGWLEEAREYSELINAWGAIQAEEVEARAPVAQQRLFE